MNIRPSFNDSLPLTLALDAAKEVTEQIQDHCLSENVRVTAHTPAALSRFSRLPAASQKIVLSRLTDFLRACESARAQGIPFRESRRIIRFGLSQLRLNLGAGAIEQFSEDDVVEVYSADFIQLYRNFRFLEICSYSILDLYSHPWDELYRRPAKITEQIVRGIRQCIEQPSEHPAIVDVPGHFLEEIFSEERRQFFVQQGPFYSLLDEDGAVAGFLGTLKAEIVGAKNHPERQEFNVSPLSH